VPREAWTRLRDVTGEPIEIWADSGGVWIDSCGITVLDADQREAFAQAWIAACHKADDQVRPALCGAVSPYAGPPCAVIGAHEDHISRGPGGVILARWPVHQAAP